MTEEPTVIEILHLEDRAADAGLIFHNLKRNKLVFNHHVVTNKQDYISALDTINPDIILSDHELPDMNSEDAIKLLQNTGKQIPFILLTGALDDHLALNYLKIGMDDYILKDNPQRLTTSIQNLIEKYNLRNQTKSFKEKIEVSEKKYHAFFDNSLDAMLLTGRDSRVYAVNKAACEIFQMSEEEICNSGWTSLVADRDSYVTKAIEDRDKHGSAQCELNMIRKNQETFSAEISWSVFQVEEGERVAMIIRDSTERVKYQQALLSSEERYRTLFKFNPLPVIIFNEENLRIVDVNLQACEHYQYSKSEFTSMHLKDIRPAENIENFNSKINEKRADLSENFWVAETIHKKKDGTLMNMHVNAHRINLSGAKKVIAVCVDVSEKLNTIKKLTDISEKLLIAEKIAKLCYWEHDFESNDFFCSENIFEIFHIDKIENPHPQFFREYIHYDDLEKYDSAFRDFINGDHMLDLEFRILDKNKVVKWVNAKGNLILDEAKKAIGYEGTLQDITSQKLALEKLKRSENRYKGLLYTQTNYFVRIGMNGNYTYCNYKFRDDYGWLFPNNNPIGHNSLIDVAEKDVQKVREVGIKAISNPGKTFQVEMEKRLPNSKSKSTLWDMIYLETNDGESELQCIGIDISDRVEAERKNEFQANLLEKIGQGVIATDHSGKINYWNSVAEKMYGYVQEEVLGRDVQELLKYKPISESVNEFEIPIAKDEIWTGEIKVLKKDGSDLPVQINESTIFDKNKNFKGVISVHSDISKLKRSEQDLLKLNKDLSEHAKELMMANEGLEQYSYIVSHNLRSPVANILGIADYLEGSDIDDKEESILRTQLFHNVQRLDNIVKDLNEILTIKSEQDLKPEPVNLYDLIENVKIDNQLCIEGKNATIHCDFGALERIDSVKVYLRSIFYNLISNGLKYKHPDRDPVMHISSEIVENKIIIRFKDNGLGIDLTTKGKYLFGLYKRFHFHVDGKGMGLFMVKTQVEILGGKIDVKSDLGEGTEFILTFKKI